MHNKLSPLWSISRVWMSGGWTRDQSRWMDSHTTVAPLCCVRPHWYSGSGMRKEQRWGRREKDGEREREKQQRVVGSVAKWNHLQRCGGECTQSNHRYEHNDECCRQNDRSIRRGVTRIQCERECNGATQTWKPQHGLRINRHKNTFEETRKIKCA